MVTGKFFLPTIPFFFCIPMTYRLSFPSYFLFLSTRILSHFWYSSQREKNPYPAALHEAKTFFKVGWMNNIMTISWTWDIRRNILVNNAVKQEGIVFCVSCAILGKKDWKHQNEAAPKSWADAQSHILRKKHCSEALAAWHNDICLGSVPSGLKGQKGWQSRIFFHQTKYFIILF